MFLMVDTRGQSTYWYSTGLWRANFIIFQGYVTPQPKQSCKTKPKYIYPITYNFVCFEQLTNCLYFAISTRGFLFYTTLQYIYTISSSLHLYKSKTAPTKVLKWFSIPMVSLLTNIRGRQPLNKLAAQAAGADPSQCNSTNRQNLPLH